MNVFSGHSSSVSAGQFTPDGKKIVSGSEDTSLIVWDPKTANSIFKISGIFIIDCTIVFIPFF
jgi:WD40 repeat protein